MKLLYEVTALMKPQSNLLNFYQLEYYIQYDFVVSVVSS